MRTQGLTIGKGAGGPCFDSACLLRRCSSARHMIASNPKQQATALSTTSFGGPTSDSTRCQVCVRTVVQNKNELTSSRLCTAKRKTVSVHPSRVRRLPSRRTSHSQVQSDPCQFGYLSLLDLLTCLLDSTRSEGAAQPVRKRSQPGPYIHGQDRTGTYSQVVHIYLDRR